MYIYLWPTMLYHAKSWLKTLKFENRWRYYVYLDSRAQKWPKTDQRTGRLIAIYSFFSKLHLKISLNGFYYKQAQKLVQVDALDLSL